MSGDASQTYYLDERKLLLMAAILAPLITVIFHGGDILNLDALMFFIIFTAGLVVFYYFWVKEKYSITVGEKALTVFALSGQEQSIEFADMSGPYEMNALVIKQYKFRRMSNPDEFITITNYTENVDACLKQVEARMKQAHKKG